LTHQFSVSVRNAQLDAFESTIGTSAIMRIRTGAAPATCATADSGTVVATLNLPSDWMAAASAGSKALSGTWQDASADATGIAGHFRIYDSGGTVCHDQGTVGTSSALTTSALTAANSNVLTFASGVTAGLVGQNVSGTGIPAGTTVIATTSTTGVTLSNASTAGVSSATVITFGFDLNVDNTSFSIGQQFTVNSFTLTAANA